ncbi:MAG TPA: cytochrome b/b6 domain-containing protein [Candidatus Methylomirabilis sp.]|nr:cytochrome b/b6 domain-containing protein [Candidatus Methylomirabilis sp.]
MLRNLLDEYGAIGKCLHWGLALLIVFQVLSGPIIGILATGDLREALAGVHKSVGLAALLLAAARLLWRRTIPLPEWCASLDDRDKRIVHGIERALYLLMLGVPLAGLLMGIVGGRSWVWLGLVEIPSLTPGPTRMSRLLNGIHRFGGFAVVGVVCVHVGFVLEHRARRNAKYLTRMLPRIFH